MHGLHLLSSLGLPSPNLWPVFNTFSVLDPAQVETLVEPKTGRGRWESLVKADGLNCPLSPLSSPRVSTRHLSIQNLPWNERTDSRTLSSDTYVHMCTAQ